MNSKKNLKCCLLAALLTICALQTAIANELSIWTKQNGGSSNSKTYAYGVSSDSISKFSYVTGSTNVGLNGNPQNGNTDYFIAKYDITGKLLWLSQVGAQNGQTVAKAIAHNEQISSNIYTVGSTTVGISNQTQQGNMDYFIASYNNKGNLNWTRQVGISGKSVSATSVTIDKQENIYVTGWTLGALSGQTQIGTQDFFIAKYDNLGNLLWTKQIGTAGTSTQAQGISIDKQNNLYISGYTAGPLFENLHGNSDYFIAKYDQNGNLIWGHQLGVQSGDVYANAISTTEFGISYITGTTDKGILNASDQTGYVDFFVALYDYDGKLKWLKQVGTPKGTTTATAIVIHNTFPLEGCYVGGYTDMPLSNNQQQGTLDYFIADFSTSGNLNQVKQFGQTNQSSYAYAISSDRLGEIFVAGADSFYSNEASNTQSFLTEHQKILVDQSTISKIQNH